MDEVAARLVQNLFGRIDGPLAMRLIVQPLMAAIFAAKDGIKDAREGRLPYGWLLLTDAAQRRQHLKEGWRAIRKVFFAALAIDLAYQLIELRWIYPGEALIMAQALALAPYAVLRDLFTRMANWHRHRVAARR